MFCLFDSLQAGIHSNIKSGFTANYPYNLSTLHIVLKSSGTCLKSDYHGLTDVNHFTNIPQWGIFTSMHL